MIHDALDYISTAYKKLKNKIKNKKVKAVLYTGINDYVVNKGIDLIGEQFHLKKYMSKGTSKFEIEKVFKEINHYDINEICLGVFPSDKINQFIMFEKMMPGKKYPFIISNIERSDKECPHWLNILNISPKKQAVICLIHLE